jgi:hypothetical protein
MPVRPVSPTRPPPLAITSPLRGIPPRPTIPFPAVPPPGIPPIPAIPPIRAMPPIPAIRPMPTPASRAETDVEDRPETIDPGVDQPTVSRAPLEIGDNTSQTDMSFGMMGTEDGEASVPDTSPTGEPVRKVDDPAALALGVNGEAIPARGLRRSAPAVSVVIAIPGSTPAARDRRMPKLPISTAPESLPPPKDTKLQVTGPSPACPQCESPMAWVEEHLRFYCKSCRMYF